MGRVPRFAAVVAGAAALALLAACSAGSSVPPAAANNVTSQPPASFAPTTVTLLTHDAFAVSKGVLARFTARTGITVKIVTVGDAGQLVNRAVLTAGNPDADVLFGVDNTLLSRAVDAGVFAPYRPTALAAVDPRLRALVPRDAVVPVDYGDVCVNVDAAWFAAHHLAPP